MTTNNSYRKTKKVTLISRWYGHTMTLRLDRMAADELMDREDQISALNAEYWWIENGYAPRYFSENQLRKIKNYFGADDSNYWDIIAFTDTLCDC